MSRAQSLSEMKESLLLKRTRSGQCQRGKGRDFKDYHKVEHVMGHTGG